MCSTNFYTCKEKGIKLYNEHQYDHVPKSVESSLDGKVNHIMEPKSPNRQNYS